MGHQVGRVGHRVVILCLPLVDHLHPVGVLCLFDLRQHGLQHIGGIAHDGQVHFHILAQLAGVDVDLDDGGILGKGLGVQRHTVREAGTHRDQHVTVGHGPVGGVAAVHAHHTDVHGVAVRHHTGRHQGVGGRDLGLVQQIPQRLAGGRAAHAAAKVHQRALCRVDQVGCPAHLFRIKGGHRADGLRLLVFKLAHGGSHILWDVHQHRALAAALCNAESCAHGVGRGNARDQIGGTRAAGGQHHAGAAGGTGVTVGCVGSALLVCREHMGDAVGILIQLIVKIQHCTAGIAKNGIHALLTKNLHKNLRTVQLHGELLLFPVLKSTFLHFSTFLQGLWGK